MEKTDIIKKLSNISLFKAFKDDEEALKRIAGIIRIEKFKKDSYVISEGDTGDKMYILNKGTVRIDKKTLANDSFTVVNLSENMHVFFGELALIDNDVRSASVYALNDLECFVFNKTDFERLAEENPKIGYVITKEIAKSLSTRLRKETLDKINLIDALVSE